MHISTAADGARFFLIDFFAVAIVETKEGFNILYLSSVEWK